MIDLSWTLGSCGTMAGIERRFCLLLFHSLSIAGKSLNFSRPVFSNVKQGNCYIKDSELNLKMWFS
jgi:hypothetical protein